jgi:tRNA-uridine 2-sulfurtransferase
VINIKNKTVVVGMSGGVDSSVSALLLKQAGYRVIGAFMHNWDSDNNVSHGCQAEKDWSDVASVCAKLDIPYYSFDFRKEYYTHVFEPFLDEYKKANTPNPDILCNKKIKFNVFYKKALELGADYIATGHYARIKENNLFKGLDASKDQTYFLYSVDKACLRKVLFPIGGLQKQEVREIAREYNLSVCDKKDSTGICFIGERKFKKFINQYIPSKPGKFCRLNGEEVGEHDGVWFYTIGQRRQLGLGGEGKRWFVVKKDIKENIVYVERNGQHPQLYASYLEASSLNWLNEYNMKIGDQFSCKAKIRYRQIEQECVVKIIDNKRVRVSFTDLQWALSLQQSVVFYNESQCIGGGVIDEIGSSMYEKRM